MQEITSIMTYTDLENKSGSDNQKFVTTSLDGFLKMYDAYSG